MNDEAPFAALAFKIATDPFVGKLTFFRVYSGVLKSGSYVYNATKDKRERVGRLLQMHANKREEIEEVRAGDIAAAIGLKDTRTGDTMCDDEHPIILEAMKFPNPVIDVAIEPKTKADQDKLAIALQKLSEEDPTFRVHTDAETCADDHLGNGRAAPRDHRRPHDARVQGRRERRPPAGGLPRDDQEARREGRGEVHPPVGRQGPVRPRASSTCEPAEPGQGFVFEDKIVGGVIPREYIGPVEQGIKEALENGVLAGYPMVDVKVAAGLRLVPRRRLERNGVQDRRLDGVQGSGQKRASPVILEPMMNVEVVCPEAYMGDVLGDLSSRRGKIGGMTQRGEAQVIASTVPLSEMFGYSTKLRSMSQGRAVYSMEFAHYEEVPKSKAEEIISKARVEAA